MFAGGRKERREICVVVKADGPGAAEALARSLTELTLENDEVEVGIKVLISEAGDVTKSDIAVASVTPDTTVIAFNIGANAAAMDEDDDDDDEAGGKHVQIDEDAITDKKGDSEAGRKLRARQQTGKVDNKMLGSILAIGRYVIMICIYVGVGCIIYSIFTIQHPKGPEYTIPISPTMQCVINLTFQFFFVYIWIWAAITIKEFTQFEWALMMQTMENAKGVVMFCPMLSILFVGTRMYALQITDSKGSPQGWTQDGMYMATWSLLIQFVMVLVTPCATGEPAQVDEDGNIKWEPDNKILFYCIVAVRAIGFIFLYGGIITVIVGLYTMTPETANGRGAVPLVGDGKVPGTDVKTPGYEGVKEPYGVNDVPGTPIEQKF